MSEVKEIAGFKFKDAQARKEIELVKSKMDNFNIRLQPTLIYDSVENGSFQASCINGDLVYTYLETAFPYGKILVFNKATKELVHTYTDLKLYHGNGMCYLNNKLYIASLYTEAYEQGNSSICVFDLETGTLTEINPFGSNYARGIMGISAYDENHLLCYMSKDSGLLNKHPVLLNINTFECQEYSITNTKNIPYDFYTHFQGCEYLNGKIYFLVNNNNGIIELLENKENLTFNINKIFIIPTIDPYGLKIGEPESLCKFNDGSDRLIITSQCADNADVLINTFKMYTISFETNLQIMHKENWNTGENRRKLVFVNNESTALFENGTREYPYKSLNRAIANCRNNEFVRYGSRIYIIGGNDYHFGSYNDVNITIELDSTVNHPVNILCDNHNNSVQIYDSNITFLANSSYNFIFKPTSTNPDNKLHIFSSNILFRNCTFELQINAEYSTVRFYGCSITYNPTSTEDGNVMLIDHETVCYLGLINVSKTTNGSILIDRLSTVYYPNAVQSVESAVKVNYNSYGFKVGNYSV